MNKDEKQNEVTCYICGIQEKKSGEYPPRGQRFMSCSDLGASLCMDCWCVYDEMKIQLRKSTDYTWQTGMLYIDLSSCFKVKRGCA